MLQTTVGAGDAFAQHSFMDLDGTMKDRAMFANALALSVASRSGAIPSWTVDGMSDLAACAPGRNLSEEDHALEKGHGRAPGCRAINAAKIAEGSSPNTVHLTILMAFRI